MDDIRFEPIGANTNARIELPATRQPARALNLVLRRMTEADAVKGSRPMQRNSRPRMSSPARCWSPRTDRVLFKHAYGLADRKQRNPNTVGTRFRIGSMNKMFTAVATLQLVEAPVTE